MELSLFSALMVLGVFAFCYWVVPYMWRHKCAQWDHVTGRKTLYILGSGGHTTEMLKLRLSGFRHDFGPMVYVAADNDPLSLKKAKALDRVQRITTSEFEEVTRLRNVGESVLWAIVRFPRTFYQAWNLLLKHRPDYLLCNGPAMCVPMTMAFEFLRALTWIECELIFIESYCRTENLSYTGHFVVYFADVVIVQWESLARKMQEIYWNSNIIYLGRLT